MLFVMAGRKAGNPEIFQISNFKNQQKSYFFARERGGNREGAYNYFLVKFK
jgi:hypothetical protein